MPRCQRSYVGTNCERELDSIFFSENQHKRERDSFGDKSLAMNTISQLFEELLGLGMEPKQLTFLQISIRGVIVFAATLVMVRISSKRSLAEKTAFDATLLVIIASVLARAINGSAPFFPTLGTGFVLVLLHRSLALTAYYSHGFGILIKGKAAVLVENGKLQRGNMSQNHISEHDLEEDMRLDAGTEDLSKIKVARLERSGDISFIKAE
jgi:uncharacterized membrane protein YcaP (DUF421 family)